MTQLSDLKSSLQSDNVEVLKYNENGKHEKVDKQAVLERANIRNSSALIAESLKDLTWEERFEWMHQKKLKGNRQFNKKNYDAAIQTYLEALMGLDLKNSEEKKKRMMNELQIPCMQNLASCMKQKKEYTKGVDLCTKAIDLNRENPTAYIRRAGIYQAIKDYEKATADYKTAKSLGPDENAFAAIERALQDIENVQTKRKKAYKEFFEEGSLYQDTSNDDVGEKITVQDSRTSIDEDGTRVLRYNDDLEELNRFGVLKYVAYPIKMSYKFMREKTMWCKRRRTNYVAH